MASNVLCDVAAEIPGEIDPDAPDDAPPPPPSPIHGGSVASVSTTRLTVEASPVLIQSSVGPAVAGCATPSSPGGNKPCTTVTVISGQATRLTAERQPVMLDTLAGTTDGVPPGALSADAAQNVLNAE